MSPRPGLLFYCQHSLGLGHLVRSWALAADLSHDFHVVVLSGGPLPPGLPPPPGVSTIALPPLGQAGGRLVSLDLHRSVDEALGVRRELILDAFRSLRPQVVFIELFPFGRKKFAGELLPLLDAAAGTPGPRPLMLCSVRDILVGRGEDQEEHDERARRLADRYFDAILVHGDPALARLEDSFHARAPLRVPVHYTGYVAGARSSLPANGPRRQEIIVSAGGGRVGEQLLRDAVGAHALLWPRELLRMRIIAGPFCPDEVWTELTSASQQRRGLVVERAVPHLAAEMSRAAVSVSQCGYNTAVDILRTATPALVVPFGDGDEDEQAKRAGRLERLGLLRVLAPDRLSPATLAREILETSRFEPRRVDVNLDGARSTRRLVRALLARHRVPPSGETAAVS
jgi:predicted glycosyltransferase